MLTKKQDKKDYFDDIDDFFNSKKPSEASMFMGIIALVIAFFNIV